MGYQKTMATMTAFALVAGLAMTGCATTDGEGQGASLAETGVSQAEPTQTVEFEGVRFSIPESYHEGAAPSDSKESVLYIDEEKNDYLILMKVELPKEAGTMRGEQIVHSLKSAAEAFPKSLLGEEVESYCAHHDDSFAMPIFAVDPFEYEGDHYAIRSIGVNGSFFIVAQAVCSEDNPERLDTMLSSCEYVDTPSYDLVHAATALVCGEDAARSLEAQAKSELRSAVSQQQQELVDKARAKATPSQKSAMDRAKRYLEVSAFSKEGLIAQLEYEGFSHADAEFGATWVVVNWPEQADRKAKSYLEIKSLSRSGLIEQLEYEGFTREEAEHGADSVGL